MPDKVRVPGGRVLPPASFRFLLTKGILAIGYWLAITTPTVDFHHLVGCHARRTKKEPMLWGMGSKLD